MQAALVLEPSRVEWRNLLIDWMVAWGRSAEAHDDALVSVYYHPNDPAAQREPWSQPMKPSLAVMLLSGPRRNPPEPKSMRRLIRCRSFSSGCTCSRPRQLNSTEPPHPPGEGDRRYDDPTPSIKWPVKNNHDREGG
jgi:hypothetical protein